MSNEDRNPNDYKSWLAQLKQEELKEQDSMFTTRRPLKSASKLESFQFLLMRVLWDRYIECPISELVPEDLVSQAEKELEKNTDWQRYIEKLPKKGEDHTSEQFDLGLFTLVRYQQLAINSVESKGISLSVTPQHDLLCLISEEQWSVATKKTRLREQAPMSFTETTPESGESFKSSAPRSTESNASYVPSSKGSDDSDSSVQRKGKPKAEQQQGPDNLSESDYDPADDEQTVNHALITFLGALLFVLKGSGLEAASQRARFQYDDKLYVAVTDGSIRFAEAPENVSAIIEVKAEHRKHFRRTIQQQEAGEMLAWMFKDKYDIGRHPILGKSGHWWRLLIAQDRHEFWIVIARYDDHYETWMKNGEHQEPTAFMTMTEYGPYAMWDEEKVTEFATFIEAFCLLQARQEKERREQNPFWRNLAPA